jgi:hypothetical protein
MHNTACQLRRTVKVITFERYKSLAQITTIKEEDIIASVGMLEFWGSAKFYPTQNGGLVFLSPAVLNHTIEKLYPLKVY